MFTVYLSNVHKINSSTRSHHYARPNSCYFYLTLPNQGGKKFQTHKWHTLRYLRDN